MNEENHMVLGEQYEESYNVGEEEFVRSDIVDPTEYYYIPAELVDEMFYKMGKVDDQMAAFRGAMDDIEDFLFDSIIEESNPIGEPE
jgi:hypothetical protein